MMIRSKVKAGLCFFVITLSLIIVQQSSSAATWEVRHVGTMRDTIRNGKTDRKVALGDLPKVGLYAVGPLEYLSGEITVVDGRSFVSEIGPEGKLVMKETFDAGAPFLVYSQVKKWKTIALPKNVLTLKDLDIWLSDFANRDKNLKTQPFPFVLKTKPKSIEFHVLKKIESSHVILDPHEVHNMRKVKFIESSGPLTLIGFFSRNHQGIFTHHDSYIHAHVLDEALKFAGHVDSLTLSKEFETLILLPE